MNKFYIFKSILLTMLLLLIGETNAWGETASFNFSELGYSNGDEVTTVTASGITLTFDKGTNSNVPKYYTTGSAVRVYGGGTMTVSSSSSYTITGITLTFGSGDGSNAITTDVGTYSSDSWSGSASSVVFTVGGTSGHRRIASVTVTYSSSSTQVAAPVFSQAAGEVSSGTSVSISTTTTGATIYYTTDGTTPSSSNYAGSGTTPVSYTVTDDVTLKAIAVLAGESSSVSTVEYTIAKANPNFVFTQSSVTAYIGEDFEEPTLTYADGYDGTITYSSSNSAIPVNSTTGEVTISTSAAGKTTTITATGTSTSTFSSGSASYVLTVVNNSTSSVSGNLNNATFGTSYSGTISSTDNFSSVSGTIGELITVTYAKGTASYAYINDSQIRMYNGSLLTFTAPEGMYIESIVFNTSISDLTVNSGGGAISETTWTAGNETTSSVQFTKTSSGGLQLSSVTIYFVGGGSSVTVPTPVFSAADGSSFSSEYSITITAPESGLTIYYILQDDKIYKSATGVTTTNTGTLVSTAIQYTSALTFHQGQMITAVCMDSEGNLSAPVTVTYVYTGTIVPPYYSSFGATIGDFTLTEENNSYTSSGIGTPEWSIGSNTGQDAIDKWGEERYYAWVRGSNSHTYGTTIGRYYGIAHFSSPLIDLTGETIANPTFNFIHAGHGWYVDPNTTATTSSNYEQTLNNSSSSATDPIRMSCHVFVDECNANGTVLSSTEVSDQVTWFTQLFRSTGTIYYDPSNTTRSGLFDRQNSGDISLNDFVGKYIKIRFTFEGGPSYYGTWNVDQINVQATNVERFDLNAKGWTTYVFDHDVDVWQTTQNYTTGGEQTLKIYKVPEFNKTTVVLQQLGLYEEHDSNDDSERYVRAQTPVIIHGPTSSGNGTTEVDFVLASYDGVIPLLKNNLLYGSVSPNLVTAGDDSRYFVMQFKTGATRPYFNLLKVGRSVPDHKAYLNGTDEIETLTRVSNPSKGVYLLGGDDVDAIFEAETDMPGSDTWYSVQGIKVKNPAKGVYISNGKKVVVK